MITFRNETRAPLSPRGQAEVDRRMLRYLAPAPLLIVAFVGLPGAGQPSQDLASQIFDVMSHMPAVTAGPSDPIDDSTIVWPDGRKKVEMGVIAIASVVPDSASAENQLAFGPTKLIDGIELSGDPLPALRSRVYAFAWATGCAQAAASRRFARSSQKDRQRQELGNRLNARKL